MQLSCISPASVLYVFIKAMDCFVYLFVVLFPLLLLLLARGANDSIATCEFSTRLIRRLHANINAKIMR